MELKLEVKQTSLFTIMEVFGLQLPNRALSNFDILKYVDQLDISHFRDLFVKDTLPNAPLTNECGIVL